MNTNNVATQLKAAGIKIQKLIQETDITDGAIDLNDTFHVQVGGTYLCVVEMVDNGTAFKWHKECFGPFAIKEIITYIKTIIK